MSSHLPKLEPETAPHNLEVEQGLLGAMLVNNDLIPEANSVVQPEHFYEPVHARLFETILQQYEAGNLASPITLKPHFENDVTLSEIGGARYLARLAGAACVPFAAPKYAVLIRDLAVRREMIVACESLSTAAYESFEPGSFELMAAECISHQSSLLEGNMTKRRTSLTAHDAASETLERITPALRGRS